MLFEVCAGDLYGLNLADVTFNPWNSRELAVIDQAGRWGVFGVSRKSTSMPIYEPKELYRGDMFEKDTGSYSRQGTNHASNTIDAELRSEDVTTMSRPTGHLRRMSNATSSKRVLTLRKSPMTSSWQIYHHVRLRGS